MTNVSETFLKSLLHRKCGEANVFAVTFPSCAFCESCGMFGTEFYLNLLYMEIVEDCSWKEVECPALMSCSTIGCPEVFHRSYPLCYLHPSMST